MCGYDLETLRLRNCSGRAHDDSEREPRDLKGSEGIGVEVFEGVEGRQTGRVKETEHRDDSLNVFEESAIAAAVAVPMTYVPNTKRPLCSSRPSLARWPTKC